MKIKWILVVAFFISLGGSLIFVSPSPAHAAVSNWQNGATFFPKSTTMYSSESFKHSVDQLANTGANYAGLMIPYYQSNTSTHDMQPGWNTPTDASLREGIDYIHSKGMRVFLIMKIDNLSGEWHALIQPIDRNAWFSNYGNLLNKYSSIAQEKNVELFSLGVELWGVTSEVANYDNKARWEKLILDVKQRYSGLLTYGAQHSGSQSEKFQVSFWNELDFIGISAYFPLYQSGSTPEEGLYNSWESVNNNELSPLYNTYQKPILFTELGYRSITGSHLEPWSYWSNANIDEQEQARDYEALFTYWDQFDYMMGWHVWAWEGDPNAGGSSDDSFTPQNKQAQAVLEKWWSNSVPNDPEPDPLPPETNDPNATNDYSVNPNPSETGQEVIISGTVVNKGTSNSSHMIVFVFDSNWQKVKQKDYVNHPLNPGESNDFDMSWTPEKTGDYYVAVGLFDHNWQGTYWVDLIDPLVKVGSEGTSDQQSPPEETPPPPPEDNDPLPPNENNPPEDPPTDPPNGDLPTLPEYNSDGFRSLSRFISSQVSIGNTVKVEGYFGSKNPISNANVDIEIFNSSWKQIHQQIFRDENFQADQINEYSFDWTPTQPGKYHIKVGVFSSNWSNLYWFSHDEALITVQ